MGGADLKIFLSHKSFSPETVGTSVGFDQQHHHGDPFMSPPLCSTGGGGAVQAERTQTPNQGFSEVIVSFVLVPSVSILPLRWESNEASLDGTLSSTPNHPLRGSQEIWEEQKLMERNEWRPEPSFNYDTGFKGSGKSGN